MLNRDFKEFAGLPNARGVDYLVVGGYALSANDFATDTVSASRHGASTC